MNFLLPASHSLPYYLDLCLVNYIEQMINTPPFSDSLHIPHTPNWFPNWFPFHVRSMLRTCFSTLVWIPFPQLLILFKSFSALIRAFFFRQYYDYFPWFARYSFVLSSSVLFLPYSHTQTSRHLSRTTWRIFKIYQRKHGWRIRKKFFHHRLDVNLRSNYIPISM